MNAQPFLFGEDFGAPARRRRQEDERADAAMAALEREAFGRGLEAGRLEAQREQSGRLSEAVQRVAGGAMHLIEAADARAETVERDALAFFETLARTIAGEALAARPLAGVAGAAIEAFRHLRGAPHLAVRVHESLVESVDGLLRTMARERGFEGRIIVLGDDGLEPGDARIDWADGGIVGDRRRLDEAVAGVMAGVNADPVLTGHAR